MFQWIPALLLGFTIVAEGLSAAIHGVQANRPVVYNVERMPMRATDAVAVPVDEIQEP